MRHKQQHWLLLIAVTASAPLEARVKPAVLPPWVKELMAVQQSKKPASVEEVTYRQRRAFQIMPADRAADSGNEYVLYAEDGRIICEFGGLAGHVTAGSCDINQIKFVRSIFSSSSR